MAPLVVAVMITALAACGDDGEDVRASGGDETSSEADAAESDTSAPQASASGDDAVETGDGELRENPGDEGNSPTSTSGGEVPAPRPTDDEPKPDSADTTATPPAGATGVRGSLRVGPQCPVEREGEECPSEPTTGTITARLAAEGKDESASSGAVAGSARSAEDGTFFIALSPARYELTASADSGEPCKPVFVEVPASGVADVEITCDSGIR